ncbi:MAG: hypothetical protein WCK31_00050 [bacterium]
MQNSEYKTEDFINAYKSFNNSKKNEVFNYYTKYNQTDIVTKLPAIFVIVSSVIFVIGGIVAFTITQNNTGTMIESNTNQSNIAMTKDEKVKSVKLNLSKYNNSNTRVNDFENTPRIELASFEF